MDVSSSMEIGNLLFGNSRGEIPLERHDREAERLGNLLYELGLNCYGQQGEDLYRLTKEGKIPEDPSWLVERPEGDDQRRIDVVDPNTGDVLMTVRSYWWGDYDTPENRANADKPNLEVPGLGFKMDWYKYYGRDSYTNTPLDTKTLDSIMEILRPALDESSRWLPHYRESDSEMEWQTDDGRVDCEWAESGGEKIVIHRNDKELHEQDEERPYDCYIPDGKWQVIVEHDPRSFTSRVFDSRDDAEEWAERYSSTEWVDPDGSPAKG